jgi:hypothetical protein
MSLPFYLFSKFVSHIDREGVHQQGHQEEDNARSGGV